VIIVERAVLRAAPSRVWAVLTDWERQAEWMPDVAWIRVLGDERQGGTRLAVRTRVFGVPAATDLVTVTAWKPSRRLAVEHTGVVKGRGEWLLEPGPEGDTRFTWTEDITMPPRWIGELALRAYGPWQRGMLRRSVANLRRLLEA
jgi:carbon monoxide dehydrogenase subunit G